jgi:DNA recombination protein RmuC
MQNIFNTIIIFGLIIVIYYIWRLNNKISSKPNESSSNFLELTNKIIEGFNNLRQELNQNLQITLQKQEKIVESSSKLEELSRSLSMSAFEFKTFKEVLAGPKTKGDLGERMLEEIIKNLPSSYYEKQYSLGSEKVDYIIKLNDILIPIDSKFPTQNFHNLLNADEKDKSTIKKDLIRNLKIKIEEISRKYILPNKGTVEFALMYLANEGIYYEILSDKEYQTIWDFAREKSIFITSPKNFEIICSSLLLVIRKQEFAQNINQILANINQLDKEIIELNQQFEKSYNQLKYSFNNLQELERILNRFTINFKNLIKLERKVELPQKERSLV